jgi:integrase
MRKLGPDRTGRRSSHAEPGERARPAVLELCALRWRHVDLAAGRLHVADAKTDAHIRTIDLLPALRDELATHRARRLDAELDALVFPTATGRRRDKDNVRERIVRPVVALADERLAERDTAVLPEGLTPHKLRHSFASLLVALGNDPRYVMGQLGHTDPGFTLRLYAHSMNRDAGEPERLRALVEGAQAPLPETWDLARSQ